MRRSVGSNQMEYEVYLRRQVFELLAKRRPQERDELFALFRALGHDPHRRGDFIERDPAGREIEVLVFRTYAVLLLGRSPRERSQDHGGASRSAFERAQASPVSSLSWRR